MRKIENKAIGKSARRGALPTQKSNTGQVGK